MMTLSGVTRTSLRFTSSPEAGHSGCTLGTKSQEESLISKHFLGLDSRSFFSLDVEVKKSPSRVRVFDPMDYRVHGVLQARKLEWVVFPFSRGSSQPGNLTQVSHIAGGLFTSSATREAQEYWSG